VTKVDLGTKRICPNCGTRYYDLNHNPIVCPKCGTVFEVVVAPTRGRPAAAAKAVVPVPADEEAAETELVSLEDADDEAASDGKVKTEGDEAEEEEEEADDTFLEEEEEEDDDVGDIIGDVDEEEP
jgi:uncharacterized protein (TIGR02300 family)